MRAIPKLGMGGPLISAETASCSVHAAAFPASGICFVGVWRWIICFLPVRVHGLSIVGLAAGLGATRGYPNRLLLAGPARGRGAGGRTRRIVLHVWRGHGLVQAVSGNGWKVFCAVARAIHYGGASSSNAPVRFYIEKQRADLQFWKKHHSGSAVFSILCSASCICSSGRSATLWPIGSCSRPAGLQI